MGLRIHWELCRKYGIDCSSKWYNNVPSAVCSNPEDTIELHWDQTILIDVAVEHNKPDLVIVDKLKKLWTFVDFSVLSAEDGSGFRVRYNNCQYISFSFNGMTM